MRRFLTCTKGNFSVVFALSMLPVLGAAGVAIDYSRALNVRSFVQSQTDIAAFSGAQIGPEGNDEAVLDYLRFATEQRYGDGEWIDSLSVKSVWTNNSDYKISVTGEVPVSILAALPGFPSSVPIGVASTVRVAPPRYVYKPPRITELDNEAGDYNRLYVYCFDPTKVAAEDDDGDHDRGHGNDADGEDDDNPARDRDDDDDRGRDDDDDDDRGRDRDDNDDRGRDRDDDDRGRDRDGDNDRARGRGNDRGDNDWSWDWADWDWDWEWAWNDDDDRGWGRGDSGRDRDDDDDRGRDHDDDDDHDRGRDDDDRDHAHDDDDDRDDDDDDDRDYAVGGGQDGGEPADMDAARTQMTAIADNAGTEYDYEMPRCDPGQVLSFRLMNVRMARDDPSKWDAETGVDRFDYYTDTQVVDGVDQHDLGGWSVLETVLCDTLEECTQESEGGIVPEGDNRTPVQAAQTCSPGKFMYYGWEDRPPGMSGPDDDWTDIAWTDRDYDDIRIVMACPELEEVEERSVRLVR